MIRFLPDASLRPALFLALGLATLASADTPLPGIAVLPLEAKQITRDDADILTDALANEIYRTGQVRIVERAQLEKILKEQSLETSGVCSANECAIEIGRILGLERVVVGTAGKLGSAFVISARIVDVGGGEILGSTSRHASGRIEDMLGKLVPLVARDLYSPAPPPKPAAPPPAEPAAAPSVPQASSPDTVAPSAAKDPPLPISSGCSVRLVPVDFIDYVGPGYPGYGYSGDYVIGEPQSLIPQLEISVLRSLPILSGLSWGGAIGLGTPGPDGPALFSVSAIARTDFSPASVFLLFLQPGISIHVLDGSLHPGASGELGFGIPFGQVYLAEAGLSWTASTERDHYTLKTVAPTFRIGLRRSMGSLLPPRAARPIASRQKV